MHSSRVCSSFLLLTGQCSPCLGPGLRRLLRSVNILINFSITTINITTMSIKIKLCWVQVVFSLQLGLGALTTFASYNKYGHRLLINFVVPIFVLSPHDIC